MTKNHNEDFKNSSKCRICNEEYVDGYVKVRGHCYVTGKYRGSAQRDCNIKIKFSNNIPVVFYNLENYDYHLIMQELGKFNIKIKVILNGLEKYMSFNINNKLFFIDGF